MCGKRVMDPIDFPEKSAIVPSASQPTDTNSSGQEKIY